MTTPQTSNTLQYFEEKALQLSTASSDCGEEPQSSRPFASQSRSCPYQNSPLAIAIRSQPCGTQRFQASCRNGEGCRCRETMAELLQNHDVRASFRTNRSAQEAGGSGARMDFRDIVRRIRKGNRFFLLREYPEVLLVSAEGQRSALFN